MKPSILQSLTMSKYERMLPRLFPGAIRLEVRDRQSQLIWRLGAETADETESEVTADENPVVAWSDFGNRIERRDLAGEQLQYRSALRSRDFGDLGWLIAGYDTKISVPMSTAPEPMRRAFADAIAFLQEDVEMQWECDQLAEELTERYEELNLVYSTKDQVQYIEEGREALVGLVHNCADYLDVGLAALVSPERSLLLHSANHNDGPADVEALLELLGTSVYDRVESQHGSVILNDADDEERHRIFRGREENLLAYPIADDHGATIGLIAVVARKDRHIFSNGDRNLLEVMAKKASRIIHTHHDSLTGLINRNGFEPTLVTAISNARIKGQQHCLLHIDIDQLHVINDLMGHQEGDALIRRVAKLMRSLIRDSDMLAHLGGDEFAVLLANCPNERAHAIGDKLRNAISELTVVSANRQLSVSASIGAASIDAETDGIIGIMAAAEIACKSAKEGGGDRFQSFEEDNTSLVRRSEEIEWIGRVQQALRDNDFRLYCQPVLPLADGNAPHFEILVRLFDEDGGVITPDKFIPAAERYQLMPQVDRWVIRNTLRSIGQTWETVEATGAVFCINLSGQSLTNPGFLAFVIDEIRCSTIPAEKICFEITETAAISNIDDALSFMAALNEMGCRFALDDFGAGLSSFGYLKVLPVDYLKIDGSFVREVTTDEVSLSMVQAICQIGKTMGLSTVAEFVGDSETVDLLRKIDVDYVQGFYIGKPVPLRQIIDRLENETAVESA